MRAFALPLPILLSTLVLAQHHVGAMPARHAQHARRSERDLMIEMAKRQRGTTTTASSDDGDDSSDGLLGGLLGGSQAASTSSAVVTTKAGVSSALPSSSTISSVVGVSSSASASAVGSSAISSASAISTASSLNATASASSHLASASANVTSSTASSSVISSAAKATDGDAVTTVTTDAGGSVKVITQFLTAAPSASAEGSKPSETNNSSGDGGISTGAIIGISVAAGLVVLSLIGCAIWRMKRRGGDDDDAIRWPELNRHGDSDTHHALPARQTGQHGFETGLERSTSNSSSIFAPSTHAPPSAHSAAPMTLNGSNFGATSSLEDYDYNEKTSPPPLPPLPGQQPHVLGYDEDDYTNMPPPLQMQHTNSGGAYGGYDSEDEGRGHEHVAMTQVGAPATYYHGQAHGH